ncbi:hypothetical protein WR25_13058 [Diploscapter pachys]|uniref:EGF-like domain-containing protein n=1 Tax=Diploscapter pachys TaxID=2018661 RepID=A0A2A2J2D9_9BILA|nr:hypothetical protein WR25_13058 [Diploscapter pachys]
MILRLYCAVSALLLGSLGVCQESSLTTTPIGTTTSSGPPNITSCHNGGFNYFDAEESGKCNCPSYWIGDDCETIVCTNGGYVVDGTNRCRCPIGYFGVHCEATTTIKPPKGTFSSNKLSQFNIIDLNLYTDYWGMGSYNKYKEALISYINTAQDRNNIFSEYNYWYNDFVPHLDLTTLGGPTEINYPESYTFNKTSNRISASNATDFLAAFEKAPNMPRLTRLYYCHKSAIYEAIYDMMKGNNLEQTTITVVTSQPPFPDELGKIAKDKILQMTVAFGITINVIWIEDDIFIRCKPEETQDLKELAQATGGNFLSVRYSPDDTSIADAISSIFDTMYQPQLIANGGASDCSKGHSVTVVPDRSPMPYYVFVKGENVQVSDDCIGVNTKATSYPGDMIILYTQLSPFPCPLTITSDGACSVLAVGVDQKNLGLQLYPSFVEDSQLDVSRHEPIDGLQLYVALHMEINNASLQNYSISTLTSYDDLGNSLNFTFQYRDATFELISDVVLNDPITGNAIARRVLPFKCLPSTYPPPPTTTTVTTTATTTTVTTTPGLMTSATVGSTSEYSTGEFFFFPSILPYVEGSATYSTGEKYSSPNVNIHRCDIDYYNNNHDYSNNYNNDTIW